MYCKQFLSYIISCDVVAMLVAIADREVQRILLELLNQMDGFDQNVNVKVRKRDCLYLGS